MVGGSKSLVPPPPSSVLKVWPQSTLGAQQSGDSRPDPDLLKPSPSMGWRSQFYQDLWKILMNAGVPDPLLQAGASTLALPWKHLETLQNLQCPRSLLQLVWVGDGHLQV